MLLPQQAIVEPLVIKLLRDLVAFDTQNPPGNENEIIAYCEEFLAQRGFETQIRPVMEGRSNLVARWLPAGSETIDAPQLLFSGHVDTVPVGDITIWSYPPLVLTEDGGFLYGRGTCDMKGAVAAYLAVADGVAQGAADSPSPPFSIVLTADEETGFIGIDSLAKDFPLTNVWGVILGEATGNTPVTGHKGVVWVRVTLHGTSAHASLPELGDNAILKAGKFINALTANFESMWIETYRHSDLGTPTLNVGKIAGGLKFNVIPDACEVWLDFRVPPPLDAAMVQSRLEQILAEMGEPLSAATFDVEPEGKYFWIPQDHPLARLAQEASGCAKGREFPAFTEASIYQHELGLPVVVIGPGSLDQAHAVDEFISKAQLEEAVEIYQRFLQLFAKIV